MTRRTKKDLLAEADALRAALRDKEALVEALRAELRSKDAVIADLAKAASTPRALPHPLAPLPWFEPFEVKPPAPCAPIPLTPRPYPGYPEILCGGERQPPSDLRFAHAETH